MTYTLSGSSFESRVQGFPAGLVGTVGVQILDNIGGIATARATAGIAEDPAGSGSYTITLTAPVVLGQYTVMWDTGVIGPSTIAADDLTVTSTSIVVSVPADFTYDPSTTLGKVRLEIGDTDSDAQLFSDTEINVYLTNYSSNILKTAAALCDVLALRFARYVDFQTDGQAFSRSQMSIQYAALAKVLKNRATGLATLDTTRKDGYSQTVKTSDVRTGDVNPRQEFYTVDGVDELP